jgi:iron complex transport system substrate-binding protein
VPGFLLLLALTLCLSCARRPADNVPTDNGATHVTDDAGRQLLVPTRVERVVSLAPNLTEIVYAVGAGDRLVGDTSYCDYPPQAKLVEKVGDTLHPNIERIIALRPQVVLVSTASQLEAFTRQLAERQIVVYVADAHDLEAVFVSIAKLGALLGEADRTEKLVASLRARTAAVESAVKSATPVRVFYQLSAKPLYTTGRESYITDMIRRAGGVSVTADVPGAWPRYSDESALATQPDAIVLPSGGSMGAANSEVTEPLKKSTAALTGRVFKINDDFLNRPGPRLVDGLEAMARALHPEAFKH